MHFRPSALSSLVLALGLAAGACAGKVVVSEPSIAAVRGNAIVGLDTKGNILSQVDAGDQSIERLLYSASNEKLTAISGTHVANIDLKKGLFVKVASLPEPYADRLQHNLRNEARVTHDGKNLCMAFSEGDPVMPDENGEIDYEEEAFTYTLGAKKIKKVGCPEPPGYPHVQNCRGKCMQWHCYCHASTSKADGTTNTTVCRRTADSCEESENATRTSFEGKMGLEVSQTCSRLTTAGAVNSYDHPADALGPKHYRQYDGWKPLSGQDAWYTQKGCFLPKDDTARDMLRVVSSDTQCGVMSRGQLLKVEMRPGIGDCWVTLGARSPTGRYIEVHANQGGGVALVINYALRILDLETGAFVDFKGLKSDGLWLNEDTTRLDVSDGLRRGWSPSEDIFLAGPVAIDLRGKQPFARHMGEHAVFLN
jgi:hypothetical protein